MRIHTLLALTALSLSYACSGSDEEGAKSTDSDDGTDNASGTIKVGDSVDADGDGTIDGVALDTDGDGIVDSFDSDGDGEPDGKITVDVGAGTGGTGSGGADSATGGKDAATGGQDAATGGQDAATGGSGTGGIDAVTEPKRCIGEVEASVETACNLNAADTKDCSPADGCGNEGGCAPRVSQNACVLRGIGSCGVADGGATCIVRLNDPNDAFKGGTCVQSSHAAGCYDQKNQGDCMGFDDDTKVTDLCVWDAPADPKCVALTCAQAFPFEQACTDIPGCDWR